MIESLNNQAASKASAIPRHQAIGRNGSFWMPKDIPVAPKVSGSNAHVQTKHSKGPSNSANLPNHQSVDSQPKTVNQGNRSFAGLIRSAEKSTEVKLKNNSQEAPKTNVAKSRQQFTQPRLAKILVPATNIKVRAVVAKPIAFSSSTKELQKQKYLNPNLVKTRLIVIQAIKERVGVRSSMAQEMLTYRFQWKLKIQIRLIQQQPYPFLCPAGKIILLKFLTSLGSQFFQELPMLTNFKRK